MKEADKILKIRQLMEYYGFNQREFAVFTGIPEVNVSKILRGERSCGGGVTSKILLAFDKINAKWFNGESDEMFKPGRIIDTGDITITGNNNSHISNVGHGNNYGSTASTPAIITTPDGYSSIEMECPSCGTVIEVPDTAILPLVPPEIAKKPDLNLESFRNNCPQQMEEVDLRQVWGKGVFLMRVDTRAMEPEYREGTFLVLRRLKDLSYARPDGSAYVIDTMRPHTLFRYLSKERDGTYVLNADNDKRGPMYLNAADIINIYDIVGSFRIGR